jgi:hypothetical protein
MEKDKSKIINLEDRTEVDSKEIPWEPSEKEPFSVLKEEIKEDEKSGGI